MPFPPDQLAFAFAAVVYFVVLRSTIRELRSAGARPVVPAYLTLSPFLSWLLFQAAVVGAVPTWFVAVQVAIGLAAIICPKCAVRVSGGPRPLVVLGLEVLAVMEASLKVESATPQERASILADIERRLQRLESMRISPEASEYIDGFLVLVDHYVAGAPMNADMPLNDRLTELAAGFHAQIEAWGVGGRVSKWGAPTHRPRAVP